MGPTCSEIFGAVLCAGDGATGRESSSAEDVEDEAQFDARAGRAQARGQWLEQLDGPRCPRCRPGDPASLCRRRAASPGQLGSAGARHGRGRGRRRAPAVSSRRWSTNPTPPTRRDQSVARADDRRRVDAPGVRYELSRHGGRVLVRAGDSHGDPPRVHRKHDVDRVGHARGGRWCVRKLWRNRRCRREGLRHPEGHQRRIVAHRRGGWSRKRPGRRRQRRWRRG